MARHDRILVPFDGSEPAREALRQALQFAAATGAQVRLLHVVERPHNSALENGPVLKAFEAAREAAASLLREAGIACCAAGVRNDARVCSEVPVHFGEAVDQEARAWGAGLVFIGSHGRRGLARLLLGSGAEQILRCSSVPVVVAKPPVEREARSDTGTMSWTRRRAVWKRPARTRGSQP